MITLKLKQIQGQNFAQALTALTSAAGLPTKTAYQIGKIANCLQREFMKSREQMRSILKEFGARDEQGNVITDADGSAQIPAENREKFEEAVTRLMESEVVIPYNRIAMESIDKVGLTPNQLLAIEDLFHQLEEVSSPEQEDQAEGA